MGDAAGGTAPVRWRGRRDARWMMMWLFSSLIGGCYGVLLVWVAVLVVWFQTDGAGLELSMARYAGRAFALGVVHALLGVACGLLVGLALTFSVGDAAGPPGRRAARLVGAGAHAVPALVLVVLTGGASATVVWMLVVPPVVGVASGWWHDRLSRRPRRDDYYAH